MKNKKLLIILFLIPFLGFSQWTQIGQTINGINQNDWFSRGLDMNSDGTIIAVGAIRNDENNTDTGKVQVFKNISGNWEQIGQDINGNNQGDFLGSKISLNSDGTILAIGTTNDDTVGDNSGKVEVYQYINHIWTQIGQTLYGDNSKNQFGNVSLSDDGVILATGADSSAYSLSSSLNPGYLKIYEYTDNQWIQLGSTINGIDNLQHFGESFEISNDGYTIVIGAPSRESTTKSYARVYEFNEEDWIQKGNDFNEDNLGDYLGSASAINYQGDIIALGGFSAKNSSRIKAGYVKVFQNISGD